MGHRSVMLPTLLATKLRLARMGSIGDVPTSFLLGQSSHLKVAPYNSFVQSLHLVLYSKIQILLAG